MKSIIMHEGAGRYALEIYSNDGDWLLCLHHNASKTFLQDYADKAGATGKWDDKSIREQIHNAYNTLYPNSNV